jgi:hypothetical protein
MVKIFLNSQEITLLYGWATDDTVLRNNAFDLNNQKGKCTKLIWWFTPVQEKERRKPFLFARKHS